MQLEGLDHVVLTAQDVQVTVDFYARVLGMRVDIHEDPTHTFHYAEMYFGSQKMNVHQAGHEFEPRAVLQNLPFYAEASHAFGSCFTGESFTRLNRNPRLAKDYERRVQTSKILITSAAVRLLTTRRGERRR